MFKVPQLPPSINQLAPADEVKIDNSNNIAQPELANVPLVPSTKLIICLHTKDIGDDNINLFNKFGRTRNFNPSMINIDLNKLDCEYLFVDVREKAFRTAMSKVDFENFNVFGLLNVWEKHDNLFQEIDPDINILTKFSKSQKFAFKHEFDDYLLNTSKIRSPSTCLSLLAFLVNVFDSVKKK